MMLGGQCDMACCEAMGARKRQQRRLARQARKQDRRATRRERRRGESADTQAREAVEDIAETTYNAPLQLPDGTVIQEDAAGTTPRRAVPTWVWLAGAATLGLVVWKAQQ